MFATALERGTWQLFAPFACIEPQTQHARAVMRLATPGPRVDGRSCPKASDGCLARQFDYPILEPVPGKVQTEHTIESPGRKACTGWRHGWTNPTWQW